MAKWKVSPETVNNGLYGSIDYTDSESRWEVYQDEKPFLDEVKREREAGLKENASGLRKFATIPDLVAIEILEKYGLDIHHPNFMQDPHSLKKLKYIITVDYPYLIINNA